MRPNAVVQAERLFLVSIVLILAGAALDWAALVEAGGLVLAAGTVSFFTGLFVLLVILTTRRGSRAARIILTILTVISAASMFWQIGTMQVGLGIAGVINTAQMLLMVVGTVLLFRPASSAWFEELHAARHAADEEDDVVLLERDA